MSGETEGPIGGDRVPEWQPNEADLDQIEEIIASLLLETVDPNVLRQALDTVAFMSKDDLLTMGEGTALHPRIDATIDAYTAIIEEFPEYIRRAPSR